MKKKYLLIFPLLIFADLLSLVSYTKAFYCNLNFLETSKTLYFINENIKINASWELNYNSANEIAYIQIQLFNNSDIKIWNSSEYAEIGLFEKNWTLEIQKLNIDFQNYTNILYIKVFFFYFHIDTTNTVSTFLDTIKIKIIKRSALCQLVDYKTHLIYGECLNIIAKFYEYSPQNEKYLSNRTIDFMITGSDFSTHKNTYMTNMSGIIYLRLSSFTDLTLGQNFLTFSIMNNRVYNDSIFIYELFVDKNHLIIDIINYKDTLEDDEDLEIKLSYYYAFNQTLKPLANYCIQLEILNNNTLAYINEYKTDKFGILTILIAQELFNYDYKSLEFNINIIFNGTYFLENKTLSLSLKIKQKIDPDPSPKNTEQLSILPFISILAIILVVISFIMIGKKNRNDKLLTELIIKY